MTKKSFPPHCGRERKLRFSGLPKAFSDEMATGSREENASNEKRKSQCPMPSPATTSASISSLQ